MAAEDDFGANLQPQQNLMSVLSDPRIRNGLLSFAAQAFTGGWGGPVSQFGQAMGHGLESAGNTEEIQKKHEQQTAEMAQRGTIASEHNKTQLQIAQEHNQMMKDVTATRGEYGLKKGQSAHDHPAYIAGYNSIDKNINYMNMDPMEKHMMAMKAGQQSMAAYNAMHPESGGGSMSETQSGKTPTAQPETKAGTTAKPTIPWKDVTSKPEFDRNKFNTDEAYREEFRKRGYGKDVDKDYRAFSNTQGGIGTSLVDRFLESLRPKGGKAATAATEYTPIPGEAGQP
jgi:hypothetical protein